MKYSELALVGDVGGTNMRLGVGRLDPETGRAHLVDAPEIIPTPLDLDPDHFFDALAQGAKRLIELYPDIRDGAIGFPGPVSGNEVGAIVGPITNIDSMKEPFDLNARLAAQDSSFENVTLYSLNDAEAATYAAPFVDGVSDPTNQTPLMYITMSTGVGGEVIQDHTISSRLTKQLAEFGHMPFVRDESVTTLEKLVSGPNIELLYGNGLTVRELEDLARTNDEGSDYARKVWNQVGRDFGHGLAMMVPIVGHKDIVIGGGVSKGHDIFEDALREELARVLAAMPPGMLEVPRVTFVPKDEVSTFGLVGARYAVNALRITPR